MCADWRERRLAQELDSHIQLLAEEYVRRGLPPEEAHRRARLQFGSAESTKESYREIAVPVGDLDTARLRPQRR